MAGTQDIVLRFRSPGLPEDTFELVRLDGREALSDLYEFSLDLVSKEVDIAPGDVLRNNAVIEIERDGDTVYVHGLVSRFELRDRGVEWVNYHAVIVPRLFTLSLNQQCQIYLDKDVPTIVRDLLVEDGLIDKEDFEFRLTKTYPVHEYIVQYQESDLNFARRLLEHAGIFFYFEQSAAKEKIVLVDDREAYGVITGDPIVPYRDARSVNPGGEAVGSLTERQEMRPGMVRLKDYNWRAPSVEMEGQAVAAAAGRGTMMEYGDHFKSPEEGRILALVRAQEISCREIVFQGQSAVRPFRSGARFTLIDHFRSAQNREYLLIEVTHHGEQTGVVGTAAGGEANRVSYSNDFLAIPAEAQFRPARTTPKPRIYGTMHATIDASGTGDYAELDELGRYKVRLPFDLSNNGGGKASRFIRMAQPYAGEDHGMHFPLLKGTEVLLTHIDGDPDRPIISASVPNALTNSPVTANNQSQNIIQTSGQNQMTMEDQVGGRFVQLSTPEASNGASFVHLGNPTTVLQDMIGTTVPTEAPPNIDVAFLINAPSVSVPVYGTMQFYVILTRGTDPRVTWELIPNDPKYGAIDANGIFTAPPDLAEMDDARPQVRAKATSVINPAVSIEAKIYIYEPFVEPPNIFLAPQTVRMEIGESTQLTAITVGVTQDNSGLKWEVVGGDANGTVSAGGLYTPPATVPSPSTVTVRVSFASMQGSPVKESQISIFPAGSRNPTIVTVAVSPRTVQLGPNGTQQFTATVTGAANPAVTWSIVDGPGTIDGSTGLFTAPAGFSSPAVVNIRATSQQSAGRFGEVMIILYKPAEPPVEIFVEPDFCDLALDRTKQLTAVVVGPTNTAVTWSVDGGAANGSVDAGGLYTPPAAMPASPAVTVRATSDADPTQLAVARINLLVAGSQMEIVVTPGTKDVVALKTQLFTATVTGASNTNVTWSVDGGAANGTISTTGTYTAPASPVPTAPVTIRATSALLPAKVATATVNLLDKTPQATFIWDKITGKVTEYLSSGELAEGDLAVGSNNSVSLTRHYGFSETQMDAYSSTIGNSWGYIRGNADTKIDGTSDTTVEKLSSTYNHGGAFTLNIGHCTNLTLGSQLNVALPFAVNFTAGIWANIVLPGFTIDAYLGAKVTINKGRNYKFYDVDDFEVVEKESTMGARNKVHISCGPMNPAGLLAKFQGGLAGLPLTGWTAPDPTCNFVLLPDSIESDVVKPTGFISFKVGGAEQMKITKTEITLANAPKITVAAPTVVVQAASTNIANAVQVQGTPPPQAAPPPPVVAQPVVQPVVPPVVPLVIP